MRTVILIIMDINPKQILLNCFNVAVSAAHPENILAPYLPEDRTSPVIVIGVGKAAASMAAAFEKHWQGPIKGRVVTPYGHSLECHHIKVIEASHPTPDESSIDAARQVLGLCNKLTDKDKVFILLSGGGSSLLCLPADGVAFTDKQRINKALLKSGAIIDEINCVRKHLSAIKGGRLAAHIYPAEIHTITISDVVGDDPTVIASGPTVIDPTTSIDALNILKKYSIDCPPSITEWLNNPLSETLKKQAANTKYSIIGNAKKSLQKVAEFARSQNIDVIELGELDGDARKLGQKIANDYKHLKVDKPTLVISGGETTVQVNGNGRGGRNCEFLLSLALSLKGKSNIYALAADTDGIDGCEDNAGAYITPDTIDKALKAGLNLNNMLDDNDSYNAFKKLDDLLITGPTKTNVNDFRAMLILPD